MVFALGLSACANVPLSVPQSSGNSPNTDYKFELTGDINGQPFYGTAVVPVSKQYTVHVQSHSDVDLMKITTCHRDWSDQDHPIQDGWFKPKRQFSFVFSPTDGIENYGTCLLRIGAFNKEGHSQDYAVIDFLTPESVLPAFNKCNGDAYQVGGVSICQSQAGLDEELDFLVPVELSDLTNIKCKFNPPKDKMHWLYAMPQGECIVYFQEISLPHRIHRHTSEGYGQIQMRN